jgi:phosphoserine aminotransferase
MNVVFRLRKGSADIEKKIVSEAKSQGLVAFEGHRSVGGFRASIYNAQSLENVEKLVAFLTKFEADNQLSSL